MELAVALSPRLLVAPLAALVAVAARPAPAPITSTVRLAATTPPPASVTAAVPPRAGWRPACEQIFDQARRDAAIAAGVHFERTYHPAGAAFPDEQVFASPNGIELQIELAPNEGQAGADMSFIDDAQRAAGGWLRQAYEVEGLVLDTRELGEAVVVKIVLLARTTLEWDSRRARVATILEHAGERCQALAAPPP